MSTDFEEALITFGQSLYAKWSNVPEREHCKRKLLQIIDGEFGEDNAFSTALKGIINRAAEERSGK